MKGTYRYCYQCPSCEDLANEPTTLCPHCGFHNGYQFRKVIFKRQRHVYFFRPSTWKSCWWGEVIEIPVVKKRVKRK